MPGGNKTTFLLQTLESDLQGLQPQEVILPLGSITADAQTSQKKQAQLVQEPADAQIQKPQEQEQATSSPSPSPAPPDNLPIQSQKQEKAQTAQKTQKQSMPPENKEKDLDQEIKQQYKAKVQNLQQEIEELKQEKNQLYVQSQKNKQKLSAQIQSLQNKLDQTQQQNQQTKTLIQEKQQLTQQINTIKQQLDQQKKIEQKKNSQITNLQKQISQLQEKIQQQSLPQAQKQNIIQSQVPATIKPTQIQTQASKKKQIIIALISAIAIFGTGVGVYYLLQRPSKKIIINPPEQNTQEQITTEITQPTAKTTTPINSLIPVQKQLTLDELNQLINSNEKLPALAQITASDITIPLPKQLIDQPANLLLFGQGNPRLGLVIKINDSLSALSALTAWEPSMASDLKELFITNTPMQAIFKPDLSYPHIVVRFQDTPDLNNSLHYTLINNKIIITTSRQNMDLILTAVLQDT